MNLNLNLPHLFLQDKIDFVKVFVNWCCENIYFLLFLTPTMAL